METAPSGGYADSIDSLSPRSRGGESWDEPLPSSTAAAAAAATHTSKLRLMCSYGGRIVPRPHDKTLCYLGGETRIVALDRHSTLADLHARVSSSLLGGAPFSLKYQLPSEDLDSLISVSTDEDLENMVEEYDRIAAASSDGGGRKAPRLRLFLFPAKPESPGLSSSSISSLLDDSKSETWFVDALNGAVLARNHSSADSAASSVNCLLGLDDSYPSPNAAETRRDSSGKLGGGGRQGGPDVQSIPDSPMLETSSSFGSASSAPSLSSLPPIKVRADERGTDLRAIEAGMEEAFAQMSVSSQQRQQAPQPLDVEGFKHHLYHFPPPPLPTVNPNANSSTATAGETPFNVSPADNPNTGSVFSSDDDKSHDGGIQRSASQQFPRQQSPQLHPQGQQLLDISDDTGSRSAYCQERPSPASDPKQQEIHIADVSCRLPVHITDQGYLLHQPPVQLPSMRAVEQLQQQQLQQQTQQQKADPHVAQHHHATGSVLPVPSYYYQMPIHPQQQLPQVAAHSYSPQMPMYFLPIQHTSAYNLHVQPKLGDAIAAGPIPPTSKPAIPPLNSVFPPQVAPPHKPELPANIYQTGIAPTPALSQPPQPTRLIHLDQSHQYVGYRPLQHSTAQSAATAPGAGGYGYEYADALRAAHAYQMYYTPASSTALPPQYQVISTGAVTGDPALAIKQPTDAKQTSAS